MGALVTEADIAYLQSLYPSAGVKPLTNQQEQFVMQYLKGQSVAASERAAGYRAGAGRDLLRLEHIQHVIAHLREKEFSDVRVTRETITEMIIQAHQHSATSTEELNAAKELGKLHGLYESDKQTGTNIEVNLGDNITNIKQLERLDSQTLLRMAGEDILLDPSQYAEVVDND